MVIFLVKKFIILVKEMVIFLAKNVFCQKKCMCGQKFYIFLA